MPTTYNYSAYNDVINDVLDELNDIDITNSITREAFQQYILQACQKISIRIRVRQQMELRLLAGKTVYEFSDTTRPVTGTGQVNTFSNKTITGKTIAGTGTISTSGSDVTGVGTLFLSELSIGQMIVVGSEKKMVSNITSNLLCTIDGSFDADLSGSAFSYSTTKFTKEINEGSTLVINSVSCVVDSITDGYNLTLVEPFASTLSNQAFTIDTAVYEIPSKFHEITQFERIEDSIPRCVKIVNYETLLHQSKMDAGVGLYSGYDIPSLAAMWRDASGRNYLRIYPSITSDKQMTIYGYVQINPRFYMNDALTANIPLSQEYEPLIRSYVKHLVHKRNKKYDEANYCYAEFENGVRENISNVPSYPKIQMTYH